MPQKPATHWRAPTTPQPILPHHHLIKHLLSCLYRIIFHSIIPIATVILATATYQLTHLAYSDLRDQNPITTAALLIFALSTLTGCILAYKNSLRKILLLLLLLTLTTIPVCTIIGNTFLRPVDFPPPLLLPTYTDLSSNCESSIFATSLAVLSTPACDTAASRASLLGNEELWDFNNQLREWRNLAFVKHAEEIEEREGRWRRSSWGWEDEAEEAERMEGRWWREYLEREYVGGLNKVRLECRKGEEGRRWDCERVGFVGG